MNISITSLKKIETVSELKLLIYMTENVESDGTIKDSVKGLMDKSGLARNSVNKALAELIEKKIIEKIVTGKGTAPNTYLVSSVVTPKVVTPKLEQGWKKATGSKAELKSEEDNYININNNILISFKDINFINKDINSLSEVNNNIYKSDEELGKLARRILIEWFMPMAKFTSKMPNYFFPQQMKLIKDLLVMYRTEQVLAGIEYWTKINPPKGGLRSMVYLNYKRKEVPFMVIALDYYKQQYVAKQHEIEEEERKAKVEDMKQNAIEIAKQKQEERKKIAEMSDNDFVTDLLGSLGSIKIGG